MDGNGNGIGIDVDDVETVPKSAVVGEFMKMMKLAASVFREGSALPPTVAEAEACSYISFM